MADDKDRLGDKLHQREKADEDRYFAQRDRELLAKLRKERSGAAPLTCPRCSTALQSIEHHDVVVDECPSCHGVWLDHGELRALAPRERESWIGRFLYRPKPVV